MIICYDIWQFIYNKKFISVSPTSTLFVQIFFMRCTFQTILIAYKRKKQKNYE